MMTNSTMKKQFRETISFPGLLGTSQCDIEVWVDDEHTYLIAIETEENKGTSITNAAEIVHWIGICMCRERGIPTRSMVHIETYEKEGSTSTGAFDLITFTKGDEYYSRAPAGMQTEAITAPGMMKIIHTPKTPLSRPEWSRLGINLTPEQIQAAVRNIKHGNHNT